MGYLDQPMAQFTVVVWHGRRMLRLRHSGEGSYIFGQSYFVEYLP